MILEKAGVFAEVGSTVGASPNTAALLWPVPD